MKSAVAVLLIVAAVLVSGCIGQSSAPTGAAVSGADIMEFYGAECPHCKNMEPIVAQVEADLGLNITKLEIWHDEYNQNKFMEYEDLIKRSCGGLGVPTFVNLKSGKAACGELSAAELNAFIKG
jgi:thiol-disulfide isomerase/thioredoxin